MGVGTWSKKTKKHPYVINEQPLTDMGLEPHQIFFLNSKSINIAASPSQSLDTKRGVADISVVL